MTRRVRGLSVSLAALVILLGAVPRAAEASLIGDSVACVGDGFIGCVPGTATVAPGPEFTLTLVVISSPLWSVDLGPSSITLQALGNLFLGGSVTFDDLNSSAGDIVGVSVVTAGGVIGIDASDLTFTADSVSIQADGNWPQGSTAVISLIFANPTTVAAPATLLLVGVALVGVGAWRRLRAA